MNTAYIQAHVGKKLPDSNLTILEDLGTRHIFNGIRRVFKVQCDCGTIKEYITSIILDGKAKTCGNCQYSKDRKINALKQGTIISNMRKHEKAILLENKEHNFFLIKSVYNKYKNSAEKRRGLRWRLTPQDIESVWIQQGGKCKQTGISLTCGTMSSDHTWSIDRIDNTKDYTKDNIQIVSKIYNMIKARNTDEEMKLFAYLLSQNISYEEQCKFNRMTQVEINEALKDCTHMNRE
jgi:hypothetical protein